MTDEKDVKAAEAEAPAEEKKEEVATEAPTETPAETPAEEKKEEAPKEEVKDDEGVEVEVPKKFKALVEGIEEMSVLDLNELVKLLEKKFGVSAAAVAVAAPGGAAGGDEEQSSFTVELTAVGGQKIAVIKVIKEVLGLGLKEAKDMTDGAPVEVKKDIKKTEAEELKTKLEEAGATVTLK